MKKYTTKGFETMNYNLIVKISSILFNIHVTIVNRMIVVRFGHVPCLLGENPYLENENSQNYYWWYLNQKQSLRSKVIDFQQQKHKWSTFNAWDEWVIFLKITCSHKNSIQAAVSYVHREQPYMPLNSPANIFFEVLCKVKPVFSSI